MPIALFSVFDKAGLVPLAGGLSAAGWTLLATGGTLKALKDAGLDAAEVAAHTGAPECFGGRVKTLHPRIHGGLLFRRDLPAHAADAERLGIEPIDLVVVNLYPFEETMARAGATFEDCVEQIDIGGPSMLRSAAKNHASVTVLVDPSQYGGFLEKTKAGAWQEADRRACALEAFRRTAAYDAAISAWMERQVEGQTEGQTEGGGAGRLPPRAPLDLAPALGLRYGENPHQPAGFYVQQGDAREGMADCRQLQGKELSYNNLLDSDAAARVAWQFADPACVIVKHNSPCGMALGATAEEAFRKAYDCDPTSAFGGIAAFNRPMDAETAAAMLPTFWEVILAPGFSDEALQAFAAKKQLRLLATQGCWPLGAHGLEVRSIGGGYLLQRPDSGFAPVDQWETMVAGASPKPPERDLFLAQMAAKALKSNSIAIAKGGGTVGVGAGQTSRVESVEIACRKAGARARGAALGSDAFFPFADGIEMAAAYGVSAVIEPGGSLRDGEVVDAARRLGLWLFFTGMRHFRH